MSSPIFWMKLVITISLICIGIPGNISILYYFLIKRWKKINSYHLFIIYLASLDLMICTVRPFIALPALVEPRSILSYFVCKNMWLLGVGLATSSILILCGLSYDRYHKITKPFAKKIPKLRIHLICGASIIVGTSLSFPYINQGFLTTDSKSCRLNPISIPELHIAIYIYQALISFIIPAALILYFNVKIHTTLEKQGNDVTIQQTEIYQRNTRTSTTIRCLTIIATLFVFIPNIFLTVIHTLFIVSSLFSFEFSSVSDEMLEINDNVIFLNSVINAFVYWAHVKEFRLFYQKIFTKK